MDACVRLVYRNPQTSNSHIRRNPAVLFTPTPYSTIATRNSQGNLSKPHMKNSSPVSVYPQLETSSLPPMQDS